MMVWVAVAVSFGSMALMSFLVIWLVRKQVHKADAAANPTQSFQALCAALRAEASGSNEAQVSVGPSTLTLRYQPPHKNTPPRLTIGYASALPSGGMPSAAANPFRERPGAPMDLDYVRPVLLRIETGQDRIGKALLINREAQTGDQPFDDRVYIETDAPSSLVEALLGQPEVRSRVLRWLNEGWSAVRFFDATDTVALVVNPATQAHFDPGRVHADFQEMESLRDDLPKVTHRMLRRPPRTLATWTTVLTIVILVVGWALALLASNVWSPLETNVYLICITVGFGLWMASVPMLGLLLRGRSDSFRKLVTNVALLLVGGPPMVVGIALALNGALDGAEPVEHRVEVLKMWVTSGKSTSYHVKVRHWEPGEKPLKLRVSESTYRDLRTTGGSPDRATVVVYPGLFGWTWWDEIRRGP